MCYFRSLMATLPAHAAMASEANGCEITLRSSDTRPAGYPTVATEAYPYFDLAPDARALNFMGAPQETRHLVMKNEAAVISPPRSIHCRCGTGAHTFCWAMAGDNVDCRDVDMVAMEDPR